MKMESMLRGMLAVALMVLLAACGGIGGKPPHQLVEHAIALQLGQTQQELSQQLRLNSQPNDISINRVTIVEQTPLVIQDLQSYRVRGTYNLTTKLDKRQITQQQNPFEVYLQRQKEGKTWRLARLVTDEDGQPLWVTQRVN